MRQLTRRILFALVLLSAVAIETHSADVSIRLFAAAKPESAIFKTISGTYTLEIPGTTSIRISAGEEVIIYKWGEKVAVKAISAAGLLTDSVRFRSDDGAQFSLSTPGPGSQKRFYEDDLICRNVNGIFLLLNLTTIEKIVPGITKAEGGTGREFEFHKAQAIIARTFAYRNIEKHTHDGYNLCDDIHCQAYHGITTDASIIAAVNSTRDIVIADKDSILIMAAFHSNCGGETASAASAWVADVPYLKRVIDPYCASSRNFSWTAPIPVSSWKAFISQTGFAGNIDDASLLTFSQNNGRKQYFQPNDSLKVPVTSIRAEFGLRSAYFSFTSDGSTLKLTGKGYGHGVGLCQEGAMVMASMGKTSSQIIDFYYSGVKLLNVKDARLPAVVY